MGRVRFETELQTLNADNMSGIIEDIVREKFNADFHGVDQNYIFKDDYINEHIVIAYNSIEMYETAYDVIGEYGWSTILEEYGITPTDEFIELVSEVSNLDVDVITENGVYETIEGMDEHQTAELEDRLKEEDVKSMFDIDGIYDMLAEVDPVEIIWNTIFEAVDNYNASWLSDNAKEVLEKTGIYVIDVRHTDIEYDDTGVFLAIAGAGYSFYDSHWIPLYVETDFNKYTRDKIMCMLNIDVVGIKKAYDMNSTMSIKHVNGVTTFSKANTTMDLDYRCVVLHTEIMSYSNTQEIQLRDIHEFQ